MADAAPDIPRLSAEEYLELERDASCRHEFVDGIVYAMAGASRRHNLIFGDVFAALHSRTKRPCIVFQTDMKVNIKTEASQRFYYPDTHVTCSDLDNDEQFSRMPVLVVEVASDGTEGYDRGAKFAGYRLIASLQEYVIVQQARPEVELFRKRTEWQPEKYGISDEIHLESLQFTIPVARFYDRVTY